MTSNYEASDKSHLSLVRPRLGPQYQPKPNCTRLQQAVHTTVDNHWGSLTDKHLIALKEVSLWGGLNFPYGVEFTQKVVGVKQDGKWGQVSADAYFATVRKVQSILASMGFSPGTPDGLWGIKSELAVKAARERCHI